MSNDHHSDHSETHFTSTAVVRDIVIGMADGLTVPFALAAGLSAAVDSSAIIVTAGLAEVAAGSIAMGLGGYLAGKTDIEHYDSELKREAHEIKHLREHEILEVQEILSEYGLKGSTLKTVVKSITSNRERWLKFMMKFELNLERPDPKRAMISASTIATSYIVGGLIPLMPYFFISDIMSALKMSVIATSIALVLFGWIKGRYTGVNQGRSAMQTLVIGALASSAAFGLAHLLS
ncbi:iron transporter [Candidatus Methylopumilus planktonicus]|uniref:VIT1/CCC1 transporter family protein n=1 Tax=Candidatus Methylopumilus planktonicus TaxID=1581557 RepID=UPI0011249D77|nr:VIT1/CCC1 transporter family protein [Candidatus Methylopumilus planktonicus]QDD01019.1 iron transporter [Candidatus Methylopumilus planktonicus]